MKIIKKFDCGAFILEPKVFSDERGYFYESYNKEAFKAATGLDIDFVQDNQSKSHYGVLRGLHFQKPPYAQSKLVRVINGAVYDVIVDIRKDSPTFGKYYCAYLSEENKRMFFVPKGFAHSFITLRDNTVFQYKCDNFYNKESEGGIWWGSLLPNSNNTPTGIPWKELISLNDIVVADKDEALPELTSLIEKGNLLTIEEWC